MRRFVALVIAPAVALGWVASTDALLPGDLRPPGPEIEKDRSGVAWPIPSAPAMGEDWTAGIQRDLAAREYEASPNREGLQAPNRAHNLRTYFEPGGIRVVDRSAPDSPELLAIELTGIGRAGHMRSVEAGVVRHEQTRVEILRDGIVEWYVNSPAGLEQGFTLEARPSGDGPLAVELAVSGATVTGRGDAATFACATGRTLEYSKLAVFDAGGAALAATMEVAAGTVRLVVNDEGAAYPVTIDPLLTSTPDGELVSAQADAWFGHQVAGAGDVNGDGYDDVIVGALQYDAGETNEGAAFLFLGGAAGISIGATPATTLQGNQSGAVFAYAAGAGDVNGDGYDDVIVGATGLNAYPGGSAHLYHGGASGIPNGHPGTAATVLHSTTPGDYFGLSVSSAGDVNGDGYADVVVGAYGSTGFGAAYVFHGSATGVASAHVSAASTALTCSQAAAEFGRSVAGAGDVNGDGYADIVVGAWRYDDGHTDEGAAFTWHGSATGIADGDQGSASDIVQPDQAGSFFGYSVAGAGDLNGDGYSDVIVGAQGHDGTQADAGAAFTFHGSATGIPTGATISAAASSFHMFQAGSRVNSVAGAGDVNGDGYADIVVGSHLYDLGQTDEGVAFVYLGGPLGAPSTTPSNAYATLQSNQAGAQQGAVAGAGDVNGDGYADVVVGAHLFDGTQANEGFARVYLGGARGIVGGTTSSAATLLQSDQPHGGSFGSRSQFGVSVAGAGDVNGDGYSDVIVGAPDYDLGTTDEGAAFMFLGSPAGVANGNPLTAATTLQSNQGGANFGGSVAGAGDVNGDGYADVIVGAPAYDIGEPSEGVAFVFLGGPWGVASGDPSSAATTLQSNQSGAGLGIAVAGAGDVNGDGYADVIVGAPFHDGAGPNEGAAFLFLGSAGGIANGDPASAATVLQSNQSDATLGNGVAGAGDVNGDGFADVIVGAPNYDLGSADEGAAFIFLGSAAGVASAGPAGAATTLQSDESSAFLGQSVAGAGDVNADGYDDVIVGAHQYGAGDGGAAFVFHGSATGVANGNPATAATPIVLLTADAYMGGSVAGAGDLNGDGYADVIVGVNVFATSGEARVYQGSPTGIAVGSRVLLMASTGGTSFGASVAGAGDVNGDGFADVIIGAPYHDAGQTDEGAAFLYLGGGGKTWRDQRARQSRGDGSGVPVHPWSHAHGAGFEVGMTANDPAGRGRVKIEVEYCPAGQPFGSGSCVREVSDSWTNVGLAPSGAVLTHELDIVTPALYRWRVRTLRAPHSVTQAGITAPIEPSHGPWRRLHAQAGTGDVRILAAALAVESPLDAAGLSLAPSVNPARGRITLSVLLPGAGIAELELFDVAGRRLLAERLAPGGPGRHTLRVSGDRGLTSGVYLLRLSQGGRAATTRIVFIR